MSHDRPSSTAASSPLGLRAALRIALVEDGRIVIEKTITQGVLSFDGNRLFEGLIDDALGTFECEAEGIFLRTHLQGRVHLEGREVRIVEGRAALTLSDHGRLEHADRALLFQVVEPPPLRRAPGLPASMRGGAGLDGRFTAIALASLLGHFAFVMVLEQMDPPYVAASAPPARIVELLMEAPPPVVPPPPELPSLPTETTPTEVAEAEPTRAPSSTSHSSGHHGPSTRPEAFDAARMSEEVGAALSHSRIGALDLSGIGGTTASTAEITRSIETSEVLGTSSSTLATRTGGGRVPTEGLGILGLAGGDGHARAEGEGLEATGPVGIVHPDEPIDGPSSGIFDVRLVTRAIGRRLTAIRRCYERELRDVPSLEGSLDIAFTIQESGTVSGVHATDDTVHSDRMTGCVTGVFRGLPRFVPGPEGGSVSFTYPLVFVPGS